MKNDISKHGADTNLPAKILKEIKKLDPFRNPEYQSKDEITIGRLFSDVTKDIVRYNTKAKSWYYYDGIRWTRDEEAMITERCAKCFQKSMLIYCAGIDDSDQRQYRNEILTQYHNEILKLANRNRRSNMIKDARDYNFLSTEDFDQAPYLFNCLNCVVDLRSRTAIEHDPDLLLSKVSNVIFDPDAPYNEWMNFCDQVMLDDAEKVLYLQKLFGYCLTGDNSQEEAYLFYGATTRNGKSTMLDTIGYMFGDYGMNIEPETLAMKDRNSRGPSGDLARLDGCRFLHMSEPPKRMKFDAALFKKMTGRDKMTARNLYEREFEFMPGFKLCINTNYLPVIMDDTIFSSERLKVISFDRHFEKEEQDRHLKDRLKGQKMISGIFNWCLDGLKYFTNEGSILYEPESVQKATEDYRNKSDKINNFLLDCYTEDPGNCESIKSVYEVYEGWCRENGYGIENKSNFIDDLKNKGIYAQQGTVYGKTVRNVIKGYQLVGRG